MSVRLAAMSDLVYEVETAKTSMEEIRPTLDTALHRLFPIGMLHLRWEGDVLHLSGSGAHGTIVLEQGRLKGQAHLGLPASMMRGLIEEKIGNAMREAAG